ncbi:YuzB family protein [Bacillus sp. FJAT-45350]|uniref:YuzB family protein n=1 Tax=Bacillus sp. FJAT-45350 TaxID=2011014 RepID=UPI000BB97E92|nr:YuzB family protein [Bacillus sp. FJAT-45350]
MKPIIEFCLSNLASGTQRAKEELEKDPNFDVIEYGCLGSCGQCAANPFALVNGEFVSGETNGDLVKNIYQYLDDNPMF